MYEWAIFYPQALQFTPGAIGRKTRQSINL